MKKQLTAWVLAVAAALMGVSFAVFADVAPTPTKTIDISQGDISITSAKVTYYIDSGGAPLKVEEAPNAAGYVITGTQPAAAAIPTPNPAAIKTLHINGATVPLTLSPSIGGQLNVSGNLTTTAPLTTDGIVNIAGSLEAKSVLLANGSYSAVPVTLGGVVNVGGNLTADQNVTAGGTTNVAGDMTVKGLLTAKAPLTVKKNLNSSTAPVLQTGAAVTVTEGNLAIENGDFTVNLPLKVGGVLQTKSGSLVLNAPVTAGSISSSGHLTLNAAATAGQLYSGADMRLRTPITTGSISSGGALYSDNVQLQTTAGGIAATGTIDIGGTVIAAGSITSTAGNVVLRGAATATGAITGVNIELKGVTNALSANATGSLTADASVTVAQDLFAAGTMTFSQTAKASNIKAQGNIAFYGAADVMSMIQSDQGSIFSQGELRAWSVQALNGAVDLRGNVAAQNNILSRDALSIAGTADAQLIASSAGTVTLGGNTTAATGVKGNRVIVNNGAWLKTPSLNVPMTETNRFAVDVGTPFAAGTAVTVKATGVNDMPTTIGAARFTAPLRLWLPAGYSAITVQNGNYRYYGNVQVRASATPTSLTLTNSSNDSPGGGGGSGGVGGSGSFDEDDFWDDVVDHIHAARTGDEIRVSASKVDNMPVWVLEELRGNNVTLRISHGSVTVAMNGKKLPSIPKNRVFYQFDALKEWYEDGQKPEPKPSSSSQTSSAQPSLPLPPPASSAPQQTPPPVSSVAPKPSSSSSEESSSELEEPSSSEESSAEEVIADAKEEEQPPAPPEAKRSVLPLVIAGIIASLAAAGAVVGYLLYRRKSEEYLNDDRQDPPELPM